MIDLVIDQRRRSIGSFEVGRILPSARRRMIGPFIFFDHMGPARFPAGIGEEVDVRPHPHIGLSTVTYLFEGEIVHRDSVGSVQTIRPGEVNWLTAGRGITHSERFERARREGGPVHGIQAWVALPEADEETDPLFHHHGLDDLPELELAGARGRLIAGEMAGLRAKVRTHSPLFYLHWELETGQRVPVTDDYPERAVYVVKGAIESGGHSFEAGQMLVLASGASARVEALAPSIVMMLGGEPLGPRFIEWNFVSSSRERIDEAKADWRAGRMKLPDFDHDSFVPLPPDIGIPLRRKS